MNLNMIFFVIIPAVLMLAISVILPFWRKNILNQAGEKILPLVRKKSKLSIIALPVAYVLLPLSILIDFGKMNFVIPYCAVLGLYIVLKEGSLLPVNGVYENLIICGSEVIKLSDITGIPTQDASQPENVIKITSPRGPRILTLDNANEATEVLSALKKKLDV